jgi:hypothetical protein
MENTERFRRADFKQDGDAGATAGIHIIFIHGVQNDAACRKGRSSSPGRREYMAKDSIRMLDLLIATLD